MVEAITFGTKAIFLIVICVARDSFVGMDLLDLVRLVLVLRRRRSVAFGWRLHDWEAVK